MFRDETGHGKVIMSPQSGIPVEEPIPPFSQCGVEVHKDDRGPESQRVCRSLGARNVTPPSPVLLRIMRNCVTRPPKTTAKSQPTKRPAQMKCLADQVIDQLLMSPACGVGRESPVTSRQRG